MFWLVWLGIGLYGMIPIVIFVLTLKIYIKNVETEKRIKKIMNGIKSGDVSQYHKRFDDE